ncbi:MAG: histidine phosphatase family protein [Acidobacteriota bacterium]
MSRVYLVRHGQAGTRQSYDALSGLGKRQARLAGEYFVRCGIRFAAAYAGGLQRQKQTAEEVISAYKDAGAEFPALSIDAGWNEFDLDHVYSELAPILCEEDAAFRHEFETMRAELLAAGEQHDAEVHRRWTPSDLKIVQAWIKGHPRYNGETWLAFHDRIAGRRAALAATTFPTDDHNIVVFTSATPIGIWAALGMDVEDHRAMRLAGVLMNASISMVRLREDQIRLHMFNGVPHLEPELWTHR